MKNVTLIHEVHDMWPATLIELGGMSKNNPFVKVLQIAENSAYKNSDVVVSIPNNAEEYMKEHGLGDGKFKHIPNGVVTEDWKDSIDIPEKIKTNLTELRNKKKFIVGYFGGHALSNALDTLLDTAKLVEEDADLANVTFVLVGKGVEKSRLIERTKSENISNILFFDAVDKRSIPELLKYFDCVYMGTTKSLLYRFGLGLNKFYDAMMAAKPIILSTDAKNTIVEKYNCGLVVPAESPLLIKNAIAQIFKSEESYCVTLAQNGKKAVMENFTYDKLSSDFESCMGKEGKKNILLINHYAGSPEMGMEFRPFYFAREWVKNGNRVDIIAADYSHLRNKNPKVINDFQEEIIDGIHYHWIKSSKYEGNGVKRALTMFSFVFKLRLKAKWIAKRFEPDVIICSSTYPLDTYVGQKIKEYMKEYNKNRC